MARGIPNKHVQPGELFQPSAAIWNQVIDLLAGRRGGIVRPANPETSVEIFVRNDTDGTVPQYGVLAVGDPVINPADNLNGFKNSKLVKGTTPTASSVICVTQEPIAAGKIGRAVVAGLTQVQIDVGDAAHTYASPTSSTEKVVSGSTGRFHITFNASGTGVVWGEILLSQSPTTGDTEMVHLDPSTVDDEGLIAGHIVDFGPGHTDYSDGEAVLVLLVP
ncbi:hypothetical protein [Zavarzinella formosa]|uniref:hypothetical protein n=1 Tax=Zavarzinella formosa TaxID=360055 RepID=UPI0002EDAD59|nr:hypothetical protein [Zavarzinella formosa]